MAVKSGFFMSVNGDRRYDAAFFAEFFASFIGNGIFPNPSTNLQVVEGNNLQTVIKPGKGWINGYYVHNDSDFILQHDVADGVLKRIDRIVLQWNYLTRQIAIVLKKGVFASSPVAPALVRNTDYYELVLADVLINNGATQITQVNITDTRLNKALCGIVHGTVDQVDTTTLFNQYQSWLNQQKMLYEADIADWTTIQKNDFGSWRNMQQTAFTNWMVVEKDEFDAWFANLKSVLDGDVVTNLQNQIDQHKADGEVHITPAERIGWNGKYALPANGMPKSDLEDAVQTLLNRIVDGTLNQKGLVQLSNEINSASTSLAATPGAVKSVYDLARNGAKINSGSYTGSTSTTSRTISVGFKPKLVFVESTNKSEYVTLSGVASLNALTDPRDSGVGISNLNSGTFTYTSNGFVIDAESPFNETGYTYGWVAIG